MVGENSALSDSKGHTNVILYGLSLGEFSLKYNMGQPYLLGEASFSIPFNGVFAPKHRIFPL